MRVGVVVLHYRYWPGVQETLDALAGQTHRPEHVLVVDNCSDDGSADKLRARSDIEVVAASHNGGYAAGMNLGVSLLAPRYLDAVLLLTHEAALEATSLAALVDALSADPRLGAVGPLLAWRQDPATVYSAGVTFSPRTWSTHHVGADEPVAAWRQRGVARVDSLDGAATLIRRTALDQNGPFNESYFLYFEEADYFVRLGRLGWEVACVPTALAVQQPGQPPQALWTRNSLRFLADNAPRRALAREVVRTMYHAAGDATRGRGAVARGRMTGLAAFASGQPAETLAGTAGRTEP